jgi:hypothetical protein
MGKKRSLIPNDRREMTFRTVGIDVYTVFEQRRVRTAVTCFQKFACMK